MNPMDYWPMAREYSVWNAAVAALQFWMADLNAHILSSTMTKFSMHFTIQHQHIYSISNLMKFYLVTLQPY